MVTFQWKKVTGMLLSVLICGALTGCQAVQSGAPHPFTTLLHSSDHPVSPDPSASMTTATESTAVAVPVFDDSSRL